MAIEVMTTAMWALWLRPLLHRLAMTIAVWHAEKIAHQIVTVNWLSHRTTAINHVNLSVYEDVPDGSRTTLAHGLRLISFFGPILRANTHRDSDFWQMMIRALAIVHW